MKEKIGIFIGAFSPVTRAHAGIVKKVLEETDINKIVLVPAIVQYGGISKHDEETVEYLESYYNDFSTNDRHQQLQILSEICAAESDVSKSKFEIFPTSERTYQTVKAYQHQHPHAKLYLIMGLYHFTTLAWFKDGNEMLKTCSFVVITTGETADEEKNYLIKKYGLSPSQYQFIDANKESWAAISSRAVRRHFNNEDILKLFGACPNRIVTEALIPKLLKQCLPDYMHHYELLKTELADLLAELGITSEQAITHFVYELIKRIDFAHEFNHVCDLLHTQFGVCDTPNAKAIDHVKWLFKEGIECDYDVPNYVSDDDDG